LYSSNDAEGRDTSEVDDSGWDGWVERKGTGTGEVEVRRESIGQPWDGAVGAIEEKEEVDGADVVEDGRDGVV